ncbi:MAG TPA: LPP20 family lipoprotein [Treponemataceae bacterium]|nr:LPP20 family lipoprotein [Treponemataceae bacterium]HRR02146.1 LPP20 family lipoprotein [Treponemataceae bacterium]
MHAIIALVLALAALTGCASSPATGTGKIDKNDPPKPAWVDNPREVYSDARYVAAVGYGPDRESAEKSALGALVAVFGQNVSGETVVTSQYTEAVREGRVLVTEDSAVQQAVTSSWEQDTIVGAEIKDTWFDGNRTTYAVAVMDKSRAMVLYAELIEANESSIQSLTAIPAAERNTLDAYARFDLAATIAEANAGFVNVLSVVSPGAAAARRSGLTMVEDMRLECRKIAEKIPITVQVENDREDRIRSAFSSVISGAGFKIAESGSRYTLQAVLRLSETELPKNPNKFARYQVESRLTDAQNATSVLPWTISGREGHATLPEAEHRAVRAAEKKIQTEFGAVFSDFLSR